MQKLINELTLKIKNNLIILYVGMTVFFLGILLGVFFTTSDILATYEEYALNFYSNTLSPSSSAIKFLFTRIINVLLLFIPILLLSLNGVTVYINFIFVFYKGFIVSLSFRCLIAVLGLNGLIIFIFLSLLQTVITTLSIVLFILIMHSKNCKTDRATYILKNFLICFIICLVGILAEFLFLICILRPFNFYF